jgi:hypothetical protein
VHAVGLGQDALALEDGASSWNPDEAVPQAVRVVFQRYDVEPSGWAVMWWARQAGFKVPTRRTSAEGDSAVEVTAGEIAGMIPAEKHRAREARRELEAGLHA